MNLQPFSCGEEYKMMSELLDLDIAESITVSCDDVVMSRSSETSIANMLSNCQQSCEEQVLSIDQGYESGGSCSPIHQENGGMYVCSMPVDSAAPSPFTSLNPVISESSVLYSQHQLIQSNVPVIYHPNAEQIEDLVWTEEPCMEIQPLGVTAFPGDFTLSIQNSLPVRDLNPSTVEDCSYPIFPQTEQYSSNEQTEISPMRNEPTGQVEISTSSDVSPCPPAKPRRRRKNSKQPILWRFLLDALNNPTSFGKMIQWVDKDNGVFKFTSKHKEELSQKWGEAKRNRCVMTYQKMARALRNYINRGEVLRKVKKKLQYTFLPEFYGPISKLQCLTQC